MSNNWGNICISVYLLAWVVTFIIYKKRHPFNAGCGLICLYLLYATTSLLLYNTVSVYDYEKRWSLSMLPFIYLYLSLLIFSLPVLKLNTTCSTTIIAPNNRIINTLAIIIVLASLLSVRNIIDELSKNIYLLFIDTSAGQETYMNSAANAADKGKSISNIFSIIFNAFTDFGVFLLFYFCTIKRCKFNNILIIGLITALILGVLTSLASGSRGAFVNKTILVVNTYLLFSRFLNSEIKRKLKSIGLILIALLFSVFLAITNSRFGAVKGRSNTASIFDYSGQANLNFGTYAFNNGGLRYGDRTIPLVKKILGFNDVPDNYVERRNKYQNLKINDEVFVTYIGDIVFDFGSIGGILLISFVSYLFLKLTKPINGKILFHRFILLHLILSICSQGGFLFPYADAGNLVLFVYAGLYILFKIDYDRRMQYSNLSINRINV